MCWACLALWMQEPSSVQSSPPDSLCAHFASPFLQSSPSLQPPVKHSLLFMLFLPGCSAPQVVGMSPDLIKSSKPPVVSLFVFQKVKRHLGCAGGQRASPRAESRADPPQLGGWWEGGRAKADQSLGNRLGRVSPMGQAGPCSMGRFLQNSS